MKRIIGGRRWEKRDLQKKFSLRVLYTTNPTHNEPVSNLGANRVILCVCVFKSEAELHVSTAEVTLIAREFPGRLQ
jgi:hypothetical protein